MVDEPEARRIAEEWVRRHVSVEEDAIIDESQTMEEPFGWVYFYNSRRYLETGDFRDQLIGNAPIVVDRSSGTIHGTGTAKPLEEYLRPLR